MENKENKFEVKEDCIMYSKVKEDCTALNDLYCQKENCKFYKTYSKN